MNNAIQLTVLAAIWGASFLFMTIGAPDLGVVPLIGLRVAIATVLLLPILRAAEARRQFRENLLPLFVVGIANSAIPFCLLTYATLYVTAGVDSILNATTPLWTAIIAFVWLGVPLKRSQVAGLLVGFAGVVILAWGAIGAGRSGTLVAVIAAIVATSSYGFAANYSKRKLGAVKPFVSAFGSQFFAAIVLAPLAVHFWPHHTVHPLTWLSVFLLGAICTAVAYVIFFRLIAHVGAQYAASVTFLVPIFGVIWGAIFLGEKISGQTVLGCAVILIGTALASGKLQGFTLPTGATKSR